MYKRPGIQSQFFGGLNIGGRRIHTNTKNKVEVHTVTLKSAHGYSYIVGCSWILPLFTWLYITLPELLPPSIYVCLRESL